MKLRLVSHASVVVYTADIAIWTDPWLVSKAFNDSWSLLPPAAFDPSMLQRIDYLWLSHEHPDHLNFPSMASLPDEFKRRVTILFQDNKPERIFAPLGKLGFTRFQVLPHRENVTLAGSTRVYCLRVGTIDSCLGISDGARSVFNINDARINTSDCRAILAEFGPVDVVLDQFSIAVSSGRADYRRHLAADARGVLESVSADLSNLRAAAVIPFASLMYFSAIDNRFVNEFHNKPRDVHDFCSARGQRVDVLYPGDEYEVGAAHDSSGALARYDELYALANQLHYDVPPLIALEQIEETFHTLVRNLRARYPRLLLSRLHPLRVKIPDLDRTVDISIRDDSITAAPPDAEPDAIIHSQPLHYCFAQSWGLHTLTISARFLVMRNYNTWRAHKALFALNNAEVFLRPRYLLRRQNWDYLRHRLNTMLRYTERGARAGGSAPAATKSSQLLDSAARGEERSGLNHEA